MTAAIAAPCVERNRLRALARRVDGVTAAWRRVDAIFTKFKLRNGRKPR